MAVTARFIADFSSFTQAVEKAEAKLTDFTSGANRVEKALARMTDGFSGRRVLQEATLMERAVSDIGGVSKLTASELQRVGATANEAVAKLRALGADVPKGLLSIADAAKQAGSASGGFATSLSKVNGLLGGLGVGLSVGALVSFGKALLSDADALVKMSDRTGITTTGLQRLQAAGDDAGNTIEDMTGAINQMQNRLASGDSSALGALRALNLDLQHLNDLGPDQQFIAISDALRGVQDPAKQVQIAMDLFGRQGAQVLPTLKRGFDDLREASVGMSADTVKALDAAGDALARWWRQGKGIAADAVVGFARVVESGFNPMTKAMQDAEREAAALKASIEAIKPPAAFRPAAPTGGFTPDPAALRDADRQTAALRDRITEQAAATKRGAEALAKYDEVVKGVIIDSQGFARVVDTIDGVTVESIRSYRAQGAELSELGQMYGLTKQQTKALGEQMQFEQSVVDATTKSFGGYNRQLQVTVPAIQGITDEMKILDSTALTAQIGLINMGKSSLETAEETEYSSSRMHKSLSGISDILDNVSGKFAEVGRIATRTLDQVFERLAQGDVFGAVVAGITGTVAAVSKLWHKAEQDVNPVRQAYIDAAGGLAQLNQRAHEAGVTLDRVLNAKNPEQYKKAIDELNAALQFQDDAMKTLDETVKKYGFSLQELGPALQRQNLDKQAQQLYQDFKVLTSAGIDTDVVLGRMGESIQAFVSDALRTGTEIPAAMRPMLQRMVEMGALTDENGNAISDLDASGIHFAETMTQGFAKIVEAVQKLTDAITRGLGLAIANIPDPQVEGHVVWKVDQIPSAGPADMTYAQDWSRANEAVPMASGGTGTVNRPTLFLAGESGSEQFAFSGAGKRFKDNVVSFEELRSEMVALRQQQAEQQLYFQSTFSKDLARAVRDEAQKTTFRRR